MEMGSGVYKLPSQPFCEANRKMNNLIQKWGNVVWTWIQWREMYGQVIRMEVHDKARIGTTFPDITQSWQLFCAEYSDWGFETGCPVRAPGFICGSGWWSWHNVVKVLSQRAPGLSSLVSVTSTVMQIILPTPQFLSLMASSFPVTISTYSTIYMDGHSLGFIITKKCLSVRTRISHQ